MAAVGRTPVCYGSAIGVAHNINCEGFEILQAFTTTRQIFLQLNFKNLTQNRWIRTFLPLSVMPTSGWYRSQSQEDGQDSEGSISQSLLWAVVSALLTQEPIWKIIFPHQNGGARKDGFRMIQVLYIYCRLYFYYYDIKLHPQSGIRSWRSNTCFTNQRNISVIVISSS